LRLSGNGGGDEAVVLGTEMEAVAGEPSDLAAAEGYGRLELVTEIDQMDVRV